MGSLGEAAVDVLKTAAAEKKAARSIIAATKWRDGALSRACKTRPPKRPARPQKPRLLAPKDMPKRGKGGSKGNRVALLHAIAHIELNAIDLAWDIIARFGDEMPKAFADDWVEVGADEARHFTLLNERLKALGAAYGDLPAHDGLWQAAEETAHDVLARLAVVPLVLEARGLDVTPDMIARLKRFGDEESAAILETVYREEIDHVKAGAKWFAYVCKKRGFEPEETYQALVAKHFKGSLKPPFNEQARAKAGLPRAYYAPGQEKKT